MARVFISYKRADKDIVFSLKNKIDEALGEPCWMDLKGIESDAQFAQVIIDAIEKSEIVLFMHSKHHNQITNYKSDWTIRELSYAQHEGKRIVFVSIDNTPLGQWFTFMFPNMKPTDATSEEDFALLINNMLKWLEIVQDPNQGIVYSYRWFKPEARVTEIESKSEHIVIPATVIHDGKEYKVTAINTSGAEANPHVRTIELPETITKIGSQAFCDWNKLESINIPEGVTTLKSMTFSDCSHLKNIILPASLRSIGSSVFSHCRHLESIQLPKDLVELGNGAFNGCESLKCIFLPTGIKEIKGTTFYGCKSLRTFTIPEGVASIGMMAFSDCTELRSIDIPSTIRKVKAFAFSNCNKLQSIAFPKEASVSSVALDEGFKYDIIGEDNE